MEAMRHRVLMITTCALLMLHSCEASAGPRTSLTRQLLKDTKDHPYHSVNALRRRSTGRKASLTGNYCAGIPTHDTSFRRLTEELLSLELNESSRNLNRKIQRWTKEEFAKIKEKMASIDIYDYDIPAHRSAFAMAYYDDFGFDDGNVRLDVKNKALEDRSIIMPPTEDLITEHQMFRFTAQFTMDEGQREKKIPVINGSGCFGTTNIEYVRLCRDSAGNIFLQREQSGAGQQVEVEVEVELYVPELFFSDLEGIDDLFHDDDEANVLLDQMCSSRIDGWVSTSNFPAALRQFISIVKAYDAGIGETLDGTSLEAFCDDMMKNRIGVCRHRAFLVSYILNSIGVTCIYAGNPTHAWVEIQGRNDEWVRVDLGGADLRPEQDGDNDSRSVPEQQDLVFVDQVVAEDGHSTAMEQQRSLEQGDVAPVEADQITKEWEVGDFVKLEDDNTSWRIENVYPDLEEVDIRSITGDFQNVPIDVLRT